MSMSHEALGPPLLMEVDSGKHAPLAYSNAQCISMVGLGELYASWKGSRTALVPPSHAG